MSENNFQVVFLGVLPGFAEADARAAFAKLFKLSDDQVARIFAAHRTVLKSGVTRVEGERWLQKLGSMGVAADLETITVQLAIVDDDLPPVAPNSASRKFDSSNAAGGIAGVGVRPSASGHEKSRDVPFIFSGNGFEYFKIWIVNILLSIVTLGIYSAWAKVRNKQYFYGNTDLDGASFAYTADPVKILIGRIIAFVFLVVYSVSGQWSIVAGLIMGLLLLIFLPWIICKSLRFNARYSRYRNVPFTFKGRVGDAALAYILWPLLGTITLGILFPYAIYQQKKFIYSNHAYGTSDFEFSATAGDYYKICLMALGMGFLGLLLAFGLSKILPSMLSSLLLMVVYLYVFAYVSVSLANVQYNNLSLEQHRLSANWNQGDYLWLLLTNTLGIVVTLGLFIPWARVRTARYKAEHTQAVLTGDMDHFVAAQEEAVGALGEGVGDLFDIEIGL